MGSRTICVQILDKDLNFKNPLKKNKVPYTQIGLATGKRNSIEKPFQTILSCLGSPPFMLSCRNNLLVS